MGFASCASLILSFADGTSNRGTLAWAKHPAACDIAIPWTEYTFLVGDWCSEDVRPPDMSLLPNPLLLEGAYGMPSAIDYDDDDFSEEEEDRPEPWVVDSGGSRRQGHTKVPLPSPMMFNTANGRTLATHLAEFPFIGVEGPLYAFCVAELTMLVIALPAMPA